MYELLAQFMALFIGHENAYGIYTYTEEVRADGKLKGKGSTIRGKVLPTLWDDHLQGKVQLGIIPINEENQVRFGAIDIDDYTVNREKINELIIKHNLPIIQFRSKSGGAHLFIFTNEAVPAQLIQLRLKEIAAFIGFGNSEIFPKQIQLLKSRGDVGGWINMPYFAAARTDRYAISRDNQKLTPAEFLDYVKDYIISKETLEKLSISTKEATFSDAPPCLQHLALQGFPEGTRNNGLFNAAIYLKKANPDKWKMMVEEFNAHYVKPQLSPKEVLTIIASVDKKEYFYTCKQQPICSFCNVTLCRSRKYGIGDSQDMPMFSSLTKLDCEPPIWFMDVDGGGRLELTTDDLQTPVRLQKRCLDTLNVMIPLMERKFWTPIIQELLKNLTVVPVPKEVTPKGRLLQLLEEFCTSRSSDGENPEALHRGLVFNANDRHHFRFNDFMEYLDRKRYEELNKTRILGVFKDEDIIHLNIKVNSEHVKVFGVKLFKMDTKQFNPPKQSKDNIPF